MKRTPAVLRRGPRPQQWKKPERPIFQSKVLAGLIGGGALFLSECLERPGFAEHHATCGRCVVCLDLADRIETFTEKLTRKP
jgi:hypothetical protein